MIERIHVLNNINKIYWIFEGGLPSFIENVKYRKSMHIILLYVFFFFLFLNELISSNFRRLKYKIHMMVKFGFSVSLLQIIDCNCNFSILFNYHICLVRSLCGSNIWLLQNVYSIIQLWLCVYYSVEMHQIISYIVCSSLFV